MAAPTLSSRWFLLGFIIVMALVAVFSWSTFSRVQRDAKIADRNVYVVAWALLLYADQHGEFPLDSSLLISSPWGGTLEHLVDDNDAWPRRFTDANAGPEPERSGSWSQIVREGLRTTRIRHPIEGDGPPLLDTPGYATKRGSVQIVNEWLAAAQLRLVAEAAEGDGELNGR